MRKVEAQAVGSYQRPSLLYVSAENIVQGGMHQVRCGVVALVAFAADGIGFSGHAIADVQGFLGQHAVRDQAGDGVIGAAHFG